MKRLLLLAALTCGTLASNAQGILNLSTYSGTDLTRYAGKNYNVKVNRYVFAGWNTISLPFDLDATLLNETFGSDCRLEQLAGVENDGQNVRLNFRDCKAQGIKAGQPYILYVTGENRTVSFTAPDATIVDTPTDLTFTVQGTGERVTMSGTPFKRDSQGVYGILARDNAEAAFVNVDDITTGFYATRCYIKLSGGNTALLTTNHIGADDGSTNVADLLTPGERVTVYNISGVPVATDATISDLNRLQPGIHTIKGKKVTISR